MARLWVVMVVVVSVTGCPPPQRIRAIGDAGAACTPTLCGASVVVQSELASGTVLTSEECKRVCESAWCGASPISGQPGCTLASATSVTCGSIAYDCGYCVFGCGPNPSSCGHQCCDGPSNCCQDTPRSCRGLSCGSCPPADARCSLEACRSFRACGGRLLAEPRASVCGDATDAGIDLAEYCPEACRAMAAGARVSGACATDAGGDDAGSGDAGACACATAREACEAACSQASVRACLDCAAGCAIDFARCAPTCR